MSGARGLLDESGVVDSPWIHVAARGWPCADAEMNCGLRMRGFRPEFVSSNP
jgi:hypothetical protein